MKVENGALGNQRPFSFESPAKYAATLGAAPTLMRIDELFGFGMTVRKTVWSKRDGKAVQRREVERVATSDVPVREKIVAVEKTDAKS